MAVGIRGQFQVGRLEILRTMTNLYPAIWLRWTLEQQQSPCNDITLSKQQET